MITIPYDLKLTSCSWQCGTTPTGRTALFCCPNGQIGSLTDHEIQPDGTVQPSVVCPHDGCNFHEFIKLEGWDHAA